MVEQDKKIGIFEEEKLKQIQNLDISKIDTKAGQDLQQTINLNLTNQDMSFSMMSPLNKNFQNNLNLKLAPKNSNFKNQNTDPIAIDKNDVGLDVKPHPLTKFADNQSIKSGKIDRNFRDRRQSKSNSKKSFVTQGTIYSKRTIIQGNRVIPIGTPMDLSNKQYRRQMTDQNAANYKNKMIMNNGENLISSSDSNTSGSQVGDLTCSQDKKNIHNEKKSQKEKKQLTFGFDLEQHTNNDFNQKYINKIMPEAASAKTIKTFTPVHKMSQYGQENNNQHFKPPISGFG